MRLFAALDDIDLELIAVDFLNGAHNKPSLSELKQLPILDDAGLIVRDSQAILVYLAGAYGGLARWTDNPRGQAEIVQWLSFVAKEVQHRLCAARLVQKFGYERDKAVALARTPAALTLMDDQHNDWLTIDRPTIADCAVYPYVVLPP